VPYAQFWMPRRVVLVHHGVAVYRVYHEDDYDQPAEYWYTLNPDDTAGDDLDFDIRDFAVDGLDPANPSHHPAILRRLIDNPQWLATWQPDVAESASEGPFYRTDCPRCGQEHPGLKVIAATFFMGAISHR